MNPTTFKALAGAALAIFMAAGPAGAADKADPALAFSKEQGLPQPGLLAKPPLGDFKEAMTPRWQGSLPASFLFDPTGKLRYWWGAQVFEHEITPILEGFLAGKHIDGEARFQVRAGGTQ